MVNFKFIFSLLLYPATFRHVIPASKNKEEKTTVNVSSLAQANSAWEVRKAPGTKPLASMARASSPERRKVERKSGITMEINPFNFRRHLRLRNITPRAR